MLGPGADPPDGPPPDGPPPDGRTGRVPRGRRARRLGIGLAALAVGLLLGRGAVEPVRVSADSMAPTLHRGDRVLVEKFTPELRDPRRGDLVVFRSPQDGAVALKRVVALAGDTVEIRDAELFVNERRVPEPYVNHRLNDATYFGPVTVPARAVFLLGDNRSNSIDSRSYGGVPVARLTGRSVARIWPVASTGRGGRD